MATFGAFIPPAVMGRSLQAALIQALIVGAVVEVGVELFWRTPRRHAPSSGGNNG